MKDSFETDNFYRSSKTANQTMELLFLEIEFRMTSRDAGAIATSSYMKFGDDDSQVGRIYLGRSGTGFLHAELDDTPFQEGDVLHTELVRRVQCYSSRITRPIAIGKTLPESEAITNTILSAIKIVKLLPWSLGRCRWCRYRIPWWTAKRWRTWQLWECFWLYAGPIWQNTPL